MPVTASSDDTLFATDWNIDIRRSPTSLAGEVFPGTTADAGEIVSNIEDFIFAGCLWLGSLPGVIEMHDGEIVACEHPHCAGDPGRSDTCQSVATRGTAAGHAKPHRSARRHQRRCRCRTPPGLHHERPDALNGTNAKTTSPNSPSCAGQASTGDIMETFGGFQLNTNSAGPLNHS